MGRKDSKTLLIACAIAHLSGCYTPVTSAAPELTLFGAGATAPRNPAPVLTALSITTTTTTSITLAQPVLSNPGDPPVTVEAYIGLTGTITISGSVVSNSLQGPIDVSSGPFTFATLATNTLHTIIVVAQNSAGYSTQQIIQSTGTVAPVLNSLSISASDSSSITLAQPTLSTAGNPAPTVNAYIGITGTITITGSAVSNSTAGPIDVSAGGFQFSSLSANTSYTIIVVAQNSAGYSTQQIIQSTAGIAPILNSLSISTFDNSSITLAQPTFSTAGNPAPTVNAYIGITGNISVAGSVVSNSTAGPIDVSAGGFQFSSLSANTSYTIIVVAQNSAGVSTPQITQSTAGIAPVMNGLSITASDASSLTVGKPTFSTAGNPAPTVEAYIGLTGTISVAGTTVSGSTQGPIDVSSGAYQFTGLTPGTGYTIIVVSQNVSGSSVQSIAGNTLVSIGGSLSGYAGGTIVLLNNGGDTLNITANGAFTFATDIAVGAAYSVTVSSVPGGTACTSPVLNGSGTTSAGSNITTVRIVCAASTPVEPFSQGFATVTNLSLNGGGTSATVLAGSAVTVSFDYSLGATGNGNLEPVDIRIIANPSLFQAEPFCSVATTGIATTNTGAIGFTAPSTPGVYLLAVTSGAFFCHGHGSGTLWGGSDTGNTGNGGVVVGVLTVQ